MPNSLILDTPNIYDALFWAPTIKILSKSRTRTYNWAMSTAFNYKTWQVNDKMRLGPICPVGQFNFK